MVGFLKLTKTIHCRVCILSVCAIATYFAGSVSAESDLESESIPQQPLEPDVVVAASEPAPEPEQGLEQRRNTVLQELLNQAQRAFAEDKLMVPRSGSAFSWYQQVLDIDPANSDARQGMREITERYLVLAENAFIKGNRSGAALMLKRALRVSATPAEVDALNARYPPKPASANEFRLSVADLTARNELAVAELDDVAKKAYAIGSRLLIVARNDAEGRWIYLQMRKAVDGYRLRGNIEIGQVPAVVLIDADA